MCTICVWAGGGFFEVGRRHANIPEYGSSGIATWFHLTIPSKHGDQRGLLPGDYVLMESKHRVADSTTVLDQILSSHSHPALPPSLLPAQRFHGSGTCMEFPR
ncbi:hypothetical protein AB1N83_002597 [Pleurotus pulmonarius]